MGDTAQIQFDSIPSFLGVPVGDLEDLVPGQIAIAGYFCDNLDRPVAEQRYLARQLRYASRPENAPANAIDLGDVNVFPLEPDKHFSAVVSQCEAVLETGARMVLVGGDSSGLKALGIAAQKVTGADVTVLPLKGDISGNLSKPQPVILSVDLNKLAGIWMSHPSRLTGLSPAQMIAQIDATPGNVIAAVVFGLVPALDHRGTTETRAALAILQAVAERLEKGAP
jgi:hypothetical protein